MSGLILPGLGQPEWLCTICGEPFPTQRAQQQHVGPCARANLHEIQQIALARRMPMLDEENWDPEVAAHMREVGQRMLAEGRWTVKPHERAGFS